MNTEQEEKLKDYASQHIDDLEIIDRKTVRINELKEELKHYKKETEELRKINEASERENEDLQNNSIKYYNESRQLRDELENIKLVSKVDKQHNFSNNSIILEQYGEIEKLKTDIKNLNEEITNVTILKEEIKKHIINNQALNCQINDNYNKISNIEIKLIESKSNNDTLQYTIEELKEIINNLTDIVKRTTNLV